jgi:hypothetical protein
MDVIRLDFRITKDKHPELFAHFSKLNPKARSEECKFLIRKSIDLACDTFSKDAINEVIIHEKKQPIVVEDTIVKPSKSPILDFPEMGSFLDEIT